MWERIRQGAGRDTLGKAPLPCSPLHEPLSPVLLQQWLKYWEDLLDYPAIALSGRMNAVGLIERGRACHRIEKKWNQRQVILLRYGTVA